MKTQSTTRSTISTGLLLGISFFFALSATATPGPIPTTNHLKVSNSVESLIQELDVPESILMDDQENIVYLEYQTDAQGNIEVLASNGSDKSLIDYVKNNVDGTHLLNEQKVAGPQVMKINFKLL